MPELRRYSLRKRLLAWLLLAISVLWLTVAASGFQRAHHEADELFDAQLAEVALALLALAHVGESQVAPDLAANFHKYQQRILFQLWREPRPGDRLQLLTRSANAPSEPLSLAPGFSEREWNGELWRFYVQYDSDRDYVVQVAQSHTVRDDLAGDIAWRLILPMLLALPLLGAAVWLAVGAALRPVDAVVGEVRQRQPEHLEALPLVGPMPVEIAPLVEALNGLFARVRATLDNERRFTADAAHELRTPLAALKVQAQVALRADDGPRRQALLQVLEGVERMTHLVEQLLTLARVDPANPALSFAVCDLRGAAEQVCAELMPAALAKDLQLEIEPGPACPLNGHAGLLHTLLRNLVDNAIRYVPAGGVINLNVGAGELRLADNGPGIAPAERELALRRFHRLVGSEQSGSGLGLSIVSRIAELHGATLALEETPGGGLTVRVVFPPPAVAD
jgi:two-component system sensor histidine kinase QseC